MSETTHQLSWEVRTSLICPKHRRLLDPWTSLVEYEVGDVRSSRVFLFGWFIDFRSSLDGRWILTDQVCELVEDLSSATCASGMTFRLGRYIASPERLNPSGRAAWTRIIGTTGLWARRRPQPSPMQVSRPR